MALKITGFHHHAVRIDDNEQPLDAVHDFYTNVLGLSSDPGRPNSATVPGWWIDVGATGQIHLIGGPCPSPFAEAPDRDPCAAHVALGVEDIAETKAELERLGVTYWTLTGVAGKDTEQVFVKDPCGNMIELHQEDKCRCLADDRNE